MVCSEFEQNIYFIGQGHTRPNSKVIPTNLK